MTDAKLDIYAKIDELPPDRRAEVEDFVDFLRQKCQEPEGGRLSMKWAGALREYREKYTSLELEKKALEWRGD